jgi:hypothetical protein
MAVEATSGAITLADAGGRDGWFGLRFYAVVTGRTLMAGRGRMSRRVGGVRQWLGWLPGGVRVALEFAKSPTRRGWLVTPTLTNRSRHAFAFTGYGFAVAEGQPGPRIGSSSGGLMVYANSENLRYEKLPHCRLTYPFVRPIPPDPTLVGAQASGPIPALFLGQTEGARWLLEGAFTQERHVLSWHLGLPTGKGRVLDYRSAYLWTGGAPETVGAGRTLRLETTLYRFVEATPDRLYAPYAAELARRYRFAGMDSRLGREPVYCTWNFDVFTNLTEADCLRRMDVVAEVQRGGIFQIDHGYQRPRRPGEAASPELDVYYPDPEDAWDPLRFPSGPRGFVRACRQRGLRPTIWWSPRVGRDWLMAREHPEWLLRDRGGRPIDVGHLLLDASVPDVREFLERCIRVIVRRWGFEGIKVDFYTYMFDHPDAVFRHGDTGVAWKRWLHRLVRQTLGPHGYFLHCISCPLGNPFLALEGCDAFRAGIDIHSGDWEHHVRGSGWLLPAVLAAGKRTWYADIDSFMGAPDIPAVERRSRNAFGYITAGLLDFSGPIERLNGEALGEYRRLVARCDQGGGVRCPESAPFYGRPYPRVLVRDHAPGSRTRRRFGALATLAVFNWTDRDDVVSLSLAALGFDPRRVRLADFWSGRRKAHRDGVVTALLPGRGHAVWDVLPG